MATPHRDASESSTKGRFQVKDVDLEKFEDIASKPKEQHAFKIENYKGLPGILENFQKRIFKIEGEEYSSISTVCAPPHTHTSID